jgi:hypothetical protein
MRWRRIAGSVGSALRACAWWVTIAPFCIATDLPLLAASANRPIRLGGEPDNYPITELLGRLLWFRSRVRLARGLLLLVRAAIVCALVLVVAKSMEAINHEPMTGWLWLALFLVVGWCGHLALNHSISPFEVARLVDRRMELNAQVATAVESTIGSRLERALTRTQVRLATNRLRDIEPTRALPLVVPWRDLRGLGALVVAYAVVSYAGTLGINLPRSVLPVEAELAKQASTQAQAPSPYVTVDPTAAQLAIQSQPLPNAQTGGGVGSQLESLKQQLKDQQISSDQYQQGLRQVQQQLQSQASSSLSAQQALTALAAALKDISTTQDISDSLNQGNYQKAGDQINQLSNQLGQLSPEAKSELANRLGQAASMTQKASPEISKDAAVASSALKQGNDQAASSAMQSLASDVQQASQQISQQSQLGQQMQNVRQQLGDSAGSQGSAPPDVNSGQTDPSGANQSSGPPSAGGGQNGDQNGDQGGASSGSGPPDQSGNQTGVVGQMSSRSSGQSIQQDQAGASGGGAGSAQGASPLSGKQNSLDVRGVRLTVVGQSSGTGASTTSAGDRSVPLTAAGDSSLNGLAGSDAVPSNVPITVHQESNQVPLDRKPVVRGYFTDAGQ